MKTLLFCSFLFLSLLAHGAVPVDADMNGEYWRGLDSKAKPVFLAGYLLGSGQHRSLSEAERTARLVPLVDRFFQKYGDSVLLRFAIRVGVLQMDGKPQEEIDAVIQEAERPWK